MVRLGLIPPSAIRPKNPWLSWSGSSPRPPTRVTWYWTRSVGAPRRASLPKIWAASGSALTCRQKPLELVNMRLQQTMGSLFHHGYVTHRTDIPRRIDVDVPVPYRQNKHILFGQQDGRCGGCKTEFPFKLFEVDHVIPRSRGGTNHPDNLQLLCSHCNRVKGDKDQAHLMARLKEMSII